LVAERLVALFFVFRVSGKSAYEKSRSRVNKELGFFCGCAGFLATALPRRARGNALSALTQLGGYTNARYAFAALAEEASRIAQPHLLLFFDSD
jgi:hypothetical protein